MYTIVAHKGESTVEQTFPEWSVAAWWALIMWMRGWSVEQ